MASSSGCAISRHIRLLYSLGNELVKGDPDVEDSVQNTAKTTGAMRARANNEEKLDMASFKQQQLGDSRPQLRGFPRNNYFGPREFNRSQLKSARHSLPSSLLSLSRFVSRNRQSQKYTIRWSGAVATSSATFSAAGSTLTGWDGQIT
jgi:hypothetical protein